MLFGRAITDETSQRDVNYLATGFKCNVELFADGKSLFTIIEDANTVANDMNHDLDSEPNGLTISEVSGLTIRECNLILTHKNKPLN